MTSPDGLSRGVPAQHELHNQDPSVAYFRDEVTGAIFPFNPEEFRPVDEEEEAGYAELAKASPRQRRKRKVAGQAADAAPDAEESPGDDAEDAPAEKAVDPTSVREKGSDVD